MQWPIVRDLAAALDTLFPVKRDRRVVWGLVALAALVSTTELAATQLFSSLILPDSKRATGTTAVMVVLFLVFFGGLRVINYLREMYRLTVFKRALTDSGVNPVSDSWRWASAMELTSLLSTIARIAVVTLACFVIEPRFGPAVLVGVLLVGACISVVYRRQRGHQQRFRSAQLARKPVDNAVKVRTRVRAGEIGALIANGCVVVLIGVLLAMTFLDWVKPASGFVLFIALRLLGQSMTELSKGLMRFVRATVFSGTPKAAASTLEDEDG